MIRAILALVYATLKHAWSTRAIIWLVAWAAVPAVLLPMTLQADRTAAGAHGMILTYTPIALFAVLLVGSIWLSAYTLASERLHLQFSMLRTKPVYGAAIWLGKWLGVLIIIAITLTISVALFFATMIIRFQGQPIATKPVWTISPPDETVILEQARQMQQNMMLQADPSDHHNIPTLQQWVNRLRQQKYRVAPGSSTSWKIPLTLHNNTAQAMQFQWRLDPMRRQPVAGTWTLLTPGAIEPLAIYPVSGLLDGTHTISLPQHNIPAATPYLIITFESSPDNEPQIFFDHQNPVRFKQQSGIFLANLIRATMLILALCAATSALTLLFSAFLSFPVTVFAAHGVLVALLVPAIAGQDTPHIRHSHGHHHGHTETWFLTHAEHFLNALYRLTRSLRATLPFRRLSENIHISFQEHASVICILILLLPMLCAILAHLKIMREEVLS